MLDFLLQKIKDAIFDDDRNPYKRGDTGGLIGQVEGLFGQHQQQYPQGTLNNPAPASQDPLGDPADQEPAQYSGRGYGQPSPQDLQRQFPGIRPASEDPLGDPADQEPQSHQNAGYRRQPSQQDLQRQFPGLRPASEDPLGDPADDERR